MAGDRSSPADHRRPGAGSILVRPARSGPPGRRACPHRHCRCGHLRRRVVRLETVGRPDRLLPARSRGIVLPKLGDPPPACPLRHPRRRDSACSASQPALILGSPLRQRSSGRRGVPQPRLGIRTSSADLGTSAPLPATGLTEACTPILGSTPDRGHTSPETTWLSGGKGETGCMTSRLSRPPPLSVRLRDPNFTPYRELTP